MSKLLKIKKNRFVDALVVLWAMTVSLVTLSNGAAEFNISGLTYFVVFAPLAFCFLGGFSIKTSPDKLVLLFLLFLFMVGGLVSSLHHNDAHMVFGIFAFALLLISGLYFYPEVLDKRRQVVFFQSVFIFSVAYFVFFANKNGIGPGARLHYENKNTLGMAAATVAFLGLGLLFRSIAEKGGQWASTLFYMVAIFFLLYLAILSASRSAVLSIFMTAILLGGALFLRLRGSRKVVYFFVTILCVVLVVAVFSEMIYETIIQKFESKSGDVFDGRSMLWGFILDEAGLLGLGQGFFRNDSFIAAHSTYFSFLGRYGWLVFTPFALILFLLFVLLVYRLVFKGGDPILFLYLAMFFGFLITSVTEIMIFKAIMVYAFIFIGGMGVGQTPTPMFSKGVVTRFSGEEI